MLLKVRVEGLGVICAAAKAFGVKKRIAEKKPNKRNPQEISLQQGEFFTAQPLCAARELRGGDMKPQPPLHGCSTGGCSTSSLRRITKHRQITEGHRPRSIGHCGSCPSDTSFSLFFPHSV